MKLVTATPEAQLVLSSEWCEGRPKRRHRMEVGAKRVRFLARAGARWVLLAESTRQHPGADFDMSCLTAAQRDILAFDLELARRQAEGDVFGNESFVEELARIADARDPMKRHSWDAGEDESDAA